MRQICAIHCIYAIVKVVQTQSFCAKICNMLKHRGEILKDVVTKWCKSNGWSMVALSKKLGQDYSTTHRHFHNADLPLHTIKKYGRAMNHDFRVEFPEIDEEDVYSVPRDEFGEIDSRGYQPVTLLQAIQQRDSWRDKYYDLLEKHNELLRQRLEETAVK